MQKEDCIFCQIAKGEAPSHKIWEDENHIAFLSIFPNTEGFSVVTTKEHNPSYAFSNDDEILTKLVLAAKEVGKLLDEKLSDVGRTGMILEGFGVDHLHAKLFPMHGTKTDSWREHISKPDVYFDQYTGYISSHDHDRADDETLAELAKQIQG